MKPWYSIEEFGLGLHYVMKHWEENNFPLGGKVQIDEPITPPMNYNNAVAYAKKHHISLS